MARTRPFPSMTPWLEHAAWGVVRLGLKLTRDPIGSVLEPRAHATDPYAAYERVRAQGSVVAGRFPRTFVVAGHAAATHVLRTHHVGPKPGETLAPWMEWDSPLSPSLLDLDPPDHTRIRRLVAQAFTPRAIKGLRERAHEVTGSLLDRVPGGEPFDLVAALAQPLPITIICEMLGIPDDDHDQFRRWGEDVALSLEPRATPADHRRIDAAGEGLAAFFRRHFDERRRLIESERAPDDVLTNLLVAAEGGDRLSEQELVATCILLLGAGFETTVNLIGNGVLALTRHPEQQAWLASAGVDVLPNAVDEFLRYDAPVQFTGRLAWEDDTVDGVDVPAGATLLTLLGAANRDPAVFDDPATLDVTRANAREHLSFSMGAHHCLGAALARLEAEVAFEHLLERHPGLVLAAPARRRANTVLRGLATLPVRATRSPPSTS